MLRYCFCLLLLNSLQALSAKIPSSWNLCPKNDNECLKTSIKEAIVSMKNGNKGLSVLPLDPLRMERMEIQQGGSSPVSINLTFYQVDLIGFSKMHIDSANVDWDKNRIEFTMALEEPGQVLGNYTIDGKILVLPIQGNGGANVTLVGLNNKVTLDGKRVERNGKSYLEIEKAQFDIEPERLYVYFGNLFNGVPNLGENMNKFLNENWKVILGELKETISAAMGQAILLIANSFFKNIPVDQLYLS